LLEDRCVPSTFTVTSSADDVTQNHTLRYAVAHAQDGDTIQLTAAVKAPIVLTHGELLLSHNVTIRSVPARTPTISGGGLSRVFEIAPGAQATLSNLSLTGGKSSQGGAVFIGGTADLTLDSDILSGNQAVGDVHGNALGGAVYISAGASLTIDNTAFVNNQTNGTEESFGGAIANAGTLAITGATFTR
jgi:hypothetical protein